MAVSICRFGIWITVFFALGSGLASARQVEVVLLHTSDVQGHVLSVPDWERAKQRGGLLRCATLIQRERDRSDHVLVLDCGGFLEGSSESWVTQGSLPQSVAGWLGYDAMLPDARWISGDFSEQPYCGPAVFSGGDPSNWSQLRARDIEPFRLFEVDGIGVAVLALDESGPGPQGQVEARSHERLRHILRAVRVHRPQVVVLLWRHGRWEDDAHYGRVSALAKTFPELDVILASGSRRARAERNIQQAVYADAGSQGRYIGRVAVTFDTVLAEVTDVRADLLEATHEVDEENGLRQVLGAELLRTEVRLAKIMARNVRTLEGSSRWPGQSGVQHLVSLAVCTAGNGDIVLYGKQAKATLAEGAIRLGDLFRVAPIRDSWVALSLVAADLRAVLEENARFIGEPDFLGCHGMTYAYDERAAPGERITNLRLEDGKKPHGRKRLKVLVPRAFVEEEGLGREVLRSLAAQPISRLTRLDIDTQSALVEYVEHAQTLDLRPKKGMSRP